MKYIYILVALILTGCATTEKKAKNYYLNNKDQLAELCLDCFEDKKEIEYIKGDTIIKLDTLLKTDSVKVQIPCPDGTIIDCPPSITKYITQHSHSTDTLYRDRWQTLAELELFKGKSSDLKAQLVEVNTLYQKEKESRKSLQKYFIVLFGINAVYVIFRIVKAKLKLKGLF